MKTLPELLSDETRIDGRLRHELKTVARRLRARQLHAQSAREWAIAAAVSFAVVAVGAMFPVLASVVIPIALTAVVVVGFRLSRAWAKTPLDFVAAAALVERMHPDLQQALRTALEQQPGADGRYTFLQHRVIDRVLEHALRHGWRNQRPRGAAWPGSAHAAALLVVLGALALAARVAPVGPFGSNARVAGAIEVTPGNAEVERGSTVVIAARFEKKLPRDAVLVWTPAGGKPERVSMARSLSDPVFAFTLPALAQDVDYRVEHEGGATENFHLSVFDLPALVRADASLDYPGYTGLGKKQIPDTRRVSAVEGTQLTYEFLVNKPLARAVLRANDGTEVALTAQNPERTRFATRFAIATSQRFTLQLKDDAARANAAPPDIRIEALPNRPPELKFDFPRGDQRVSALEEIHLQAEAHDDFGLLDYGLAYAVGAGEPVFLSQRDGATAPASAAPAPAAPDDAANAARPATQTDAKFEHLLALEPTGVKPDALVTWFAWADDYGPDGKPRRTSSDPYFAEVRPFDEVFREEANGGNQQQNQNRQGGGNQDDQLLEMQREISVAIWKLRQQGATQPTFSDDVATVRESQEQAQEQLATAAGRLRDERMRAAAGDAGRFMIQSRDGLKNAGDQHSVDPLESAWTGAQGAYQALLRMQPREYRVSQQRNQRGGGGQGGNRNQRQLNQLQFRANDDRYETASEAQAMTSPEEREQLQTIGKLRDLARRQQDVNERMQELQTALQAARDDAERERIERELKRLEEEQRRMLADLDEVRQRLDQQAANGDTREAREQLERTRAEMQQSSQALQQREVSQALASGTRAQEGLDKVRDNLRRESSSRFAEQLREARQQARSLSERQAQAEKDMEQLAQGDGRTLDDSEKREQIARDLETQKQDLEKLTESLRQVTEDSEQSEPGLHRQLYDVLRQQGQGTAPDRLQTGAELLRRGFVDQARETQPEVAREFEQLRRGVERAAESVLGDEAATMRFAQSELDDLTRQLERERGDQTDGSGNDRSGEPGQEQQARGSGDQQSQQGQPQQSSPGTEVASNGSPNGEPREGNTPDAQQQRARGAAQNASDSQTGEQGQQSSEQQQQANAGQQGGGDQRGNQQQQQAQNGQRGGQPGDQQNTGPGGQQRGEGQQRLAQNGNGDRSGTRNDRTNTGGAAGGGGGGGNEDLARSLANFGRDNIGGDRDLDGPITGGGFTDWTDRLRTVETLLEDPQARQQLATAREQAEALRRDFRRHGQPPQWGLVDSGIAAPLSQVRTWLRQELARREDPTTLQPVDRDPVPERYAEAVQKYYEALGR